MRYMHDIFARPRLVFDDNGHPVGVQDGITPGMIRRFVAVYMDDILIFSGSDKEEHLRHVRMVLAMLRHHCLFCGTTVSSPRRPGAPSVDPRWHSWAT